MAEQIAGLFVSHADPSYISHSELQYGRAMAPGRWSDDLLAKVLAMAIKAIAEASSETARPVMRLAVAVQDEAIRGFAFVSFVSGVETPFATLEDLLIPSDARGQGVGRLLLDWIVDECRSLGFRRLFLESGLSNHRAHHFFEDQGFKQTSIVMMREL